MTLQDLQREIAALPRLEPAGVGEPGAGEPGAAVPTPVEVAARQGKLILRLTAATEALDARLRDLGGRIAERDERARAEAESLTAELAALRREAERAGLDDARQAREVAREAIHALDALDWVHATLEGRGDALAGDVARARADCLKRLAAAGVTEIRAEGPPDGRLHESVDAVEAEGVPRYHIVSVARRGYQWGAEVLRRAEVITAA